MKAILKFNLPEESEKFEDAQKGTNYGRALWDISQDIFRPARKHGYRDLKIKQLLDKINSYEEGSYLGEELIGLLEDKFYEILEERNIKL